MAVKAMVEHVFAGIEADIPLLVEAITYMHCVLTGLAFQEILSSGSSQAPSHLAHCKRAMIEIASGPKT